MGLPVSNNQTKIINKKKRKLEKQRLTQQSQEYKESRKKKRKVNKNPSNNNNYGQAKFQSETISGNIKIGKLEMDE